MRARDYDVEVAATGREALRCATERLPDLVILDLGLPDIDGIEVIHGLRGWTEVPILVLSGRPGSTDKVQALDAGADDYVTKPFGMDELLARLRALTRGAAGGSPGEPVHLTPTEWHLLEVLVRHPGKLLSQRQLLTEVWGSAYVNQPANLRLYMAQLRHKLEPDPARPRYLLTEPGLGYRFSP